MSDGGYVGLEPGADDFAATFDPPPPDQEPVAGLDTEGEDLSFPEEFKLPFRGLLFIGDLRRHFDWMGHSFDVRTLRTNEVLEIGLITARYSGTMGENRAYATAVVAAALELLDDQPLPIPIIASNNQTVIEHRFDWVSKNLFPPSVDAIYEQHLILEDMVDKVIDRLGKAGGSTAG